MLHSHFTTLSDDHVLDWLVARFGCACVLNLVYDIEAVDHLAKNNMLVVQEWCWDSGDEKLRAVGVWS